MDTKGSAGSYWDSVIEGSLVSQREELWRAYLKDVYRGLMDRWVEDSGRGFALKTDLYDEAVSNHNLISLCEERCGRVFGIDVSWSVAALAKRRMLKEGKAWHDVVCSDVRNLAFRPDSFDYVISNSTLDHFSHKKDITASLKELRRTMKPGGILIITLDNPSNPIVFLRNLLPYRLLKFFGFIPFYMGVTLSKSELICFLESTGFAVHGVGAIVHSPRILAIWIGFILERIGSTRITGHYLRLLGLFERVERLHTRYVSGYFVAAKASKR